MLSPSSLPEGRVLVSRLTKHVRLRQLQQCCSIVKAAAYLDMSQSAATQAGQARPVRVVWWVQKPAAVPAVTDLLSRRPNLVSVIARFQAETRVNQMQRFRGGPLPRSAPPAAHVPVKPVARLEGRAFAGHRECGSFRRQPPSCAREN